MYTISAQLNNNYRYYLTKSMIKNWSDNLNDSAVLKFDSIEKAKEFIKSTPRYWKGFSQDGRFIYPEMINILIFQSKESVKRLKIEIENIETKDKELIIDKNFLK